MKLDPRSLKPGEDKEMVSTFSEEMLKKWQKGRESRGEVFSTDPIEEAMQECLDLANYSMVIYFRLKVLKGKVEKIYIE